MGLQTCEKFHISPDDYRPLLIVPFRILYTSGRFEIFIFKKHQYTPEIAFPSLKPEPRLKMTSNRQKNSHIITPSQKKHTNQEVDPPPGPHKGKKHQNSHPKSPSSSETSSNEGEEQVAPPTHKQGLDPVNCEFTLQHTIYLNGQ